MKPSEEHKIILLDAKKINSRLHTPVPLEILETIGSTNDYLKECGDQKQMSICLAEMQTTGRGRMERQWHSPFGQNIYCSIRYPFQKDVSELSGLSLVIGLAICKAIDAGYSLPTPPHVKWPNDVLVDGKKIAGTLIEINKEALIIGIGVNVNMTEADIHQYWTSFQKLTGLYHDRNIFCAELINHVTAYLERFMQSGFNHFEKEWQERDCLFGKNLQLMCGTKKFSGIGAGINQHGHLLLKLSDGTKRGFSSGDTSLLK